MKIKMNAVKCGDCFVIESGNEKLIVDCGSDNSGLGLKKSEFAYSRIEDLIKNNDDLDLLITHFDADHYNGILEIDDVECFRNIYIPYYFFNNGEVVQTLTYILLFAKSRTHASIKTKGLIELLTKIPKLIKSTGSIHLVRAGKRIYLGMDELEALWPECNSSYGTNYWSSKLRELRDVSKKFVMSLRNDLQIEIDELNIEGIVQEFTRILVKYMEGCLEAGIKETIEEIAGELSYQYERIIEINRRINLIYESIEYDNYNLYRMYWNIRECIRSTHNNLITDMNSSSIIFHKEDDILFLGDASPRVIDYLRKENSIWDRYKVVKLQHHATERYYTNNLPESEISLISNGGYKRRRVGELFIDQANKVYCTDAWKNSDYCACFTNNGECSEKCIRVSEYTEIETTPYLGEENHIISKVLIFKF